MCTVSWLRDEHGYDLFFNRDERRTRAGADPPGVERVGSTRIIAPRDGEAGGSWVAVNDRGLSVALLNGYRTGDTAEAPPPGGEWTSRGHLVMGLSDCPDVRELREVYGAHTEEPTRSAEDSAVAFHRCHDPERGPFSPCMHREDAHTVSFTWVRVDRTRVTMRYSPDSPCRSWPPQFKTWSARARRRSS